MQGVRDLSDRWFSQPLLWVGLFLTSMFGSQFQLYSDGVTLNNQQPFFAVMMYLTLSALSGFQMFGGASEGVKKHSRGALDDESRAWLNTAGPGNGIEFKVDEERGIPFISRAFKGKPKPAPQDNERGEFNNPNIRLTAQFKDKVKNNNYEFIMRVLPDSGERILKQYKVKRNLYEFQELFNYLENKNPQDSFLREFDYNKMFGHNFKNNSGKNIYLLEDFINTLIRIQPPTEEFNPYLLDSRVQEFLQLEEMTQKLFMMSLSCNNEPTAKIYSKPQIVDEYQTNLKLGSEMDMD
mmetsp:Transcript_4469/g.6655  ORF Transcript_4469/g.6655 Transcript_4469/m.6655 type:complete len:295 (+) Transcript_4469:362-1246(+)